jgi:hypothetical protein
MIATRTIFKTVFNESPFRMGDNNLSQTDRDQILLKIDSAFRNAQLVDTFAAKGIDKVLPPAQAAKFRETLAQAANIVGSVAVVQDRLQSQVATDWVVDAIEQAHVNDYASMIDQLTAIMNTPAAGKAAAQAPAAASGQILGMPAPVVYIAGTVVGVGLLLAILAPHGK